MMAGVCTIALATIIIHQSYERFNRARWNVQDLQTYRLMLEATTNIVAERGPSNSVMAEEPSSTSTSMRRLAEYRARTDKSLEDIAIIPGGESHSHDIPAAFILRVHNKLSTARRLVDAAAATSSSSRTYAQVQHAVDVIIETANTSDMVIRWKAKMLIQEDGDLTLPVLTGLIFTHLRDYADRIISDIIAPVALHETIPLQNLIDSRLARGRVLELWNIIDLETTSFSRHPDVLKKRDAFENVFFGVGLGLIDSAIDENGSGSPIRLSTTQILGDYTKTVLPLEELRGAFLDAMISDFERKQDTAQRMLTLVCLASVLIVGLLIGIVYWVQVHLLRPLLHASGAVVELAEGRSFVPGIDRQEAREIRRLFEAIIVLNERMKERAALILKLKSQATIDGLTGLLNRSALDLQGGRTCMAGQTSLVLMDIDHFKAINDSYGHPVGDEVLKLVARLLEDHVRPGERAARFGGEEFAILTGGPLLDAIALARRLRVAVGKAVVKTAAGDTVRFTSSFGVAASDGGDWPALVRQADAALYRAKREGRNRLRFER